MAPKNKPLKPKAGPSKPAPPLTTCTLTTRSNPTRFMNFWRYKIQGGLTMAHYRLIADWPFRHALELPDMKLQRGFLLELMRLWDTSNNAFNINGTFLRPTGLEISAILCLRATGKPVDVTRRTGDRSRSIVAKHFFNSTTITINHLETVLIQELFLADRVATPSEWLSMFTVYFFSTTLFAQSNYNVPMQFWEYCDNPSELWTYQWGVAAFDFLNRQLPEIGFKAHNDVPSNPSLVGCSFALLTWYYEWAKPKLIRVGDNHFPRYKNWEFLTDCTKATFLSMLREVNITNPDHRMLHINANESWVFKESLDEVIMAYEQFLPYIQSAAYAASQIEHKPLPSPRKTLADQKRKKTATGTPPSNMKIKLASHKLTPPKFKNGPAGPSNFEPAPTVFDHDQDAFVSPPRHSSRQLHFQTTVLPPASVTGKTTHPEVSPASAFPADLDAIEELQLTQDPRDFPDTPPTTMGGPLHMLHGKAMITPRTALKPPIAPRKVWSAPTLRTSRLTIHDIPHISKDFLQDEAAIDGLNQTLNSSEKFCKSVIMKTTNSSSSPQTVYDKTPFEESPLFQGGLLEQISNPKLLGSFTPSDKSTANLPASPAVRLLRQSIKPTNLLTAKPTTHMGSGSSGSIVVQSEYELTRQYNGIDPTGLRVCLQARILRGFQQDAKGILKGYIVSTQVIDSLFYILHCFNRDPGATWSFVRCTHATTVPHMSNSTLQLLEYKAYTSAAMKGSRWVIIPVQSLSHWFLVVFDFYDREIKVYNSLPDCDRFRVAVRQLTLIWQPFLSKVMQREDVLKWQPSVKFSPSLQNNRDDVGLYIVKIVDCLVARRAINFTSDAIKVDRGRIVYNLLASSYFPGSFPLEDA